MNDEKRVRNLRTLILIVTAILVVITMVLQIVAYEPLRHTILTSFVLLLIAVLLACDGILNERRSIFRDVILYEIWFVNLIVNFLNF